MSAAFDFLTHKATVGDVLLIIALFSILRDVIRDWISSWWS